MELRSCAQKASDLVKTAVYMGSQQATVIDSSVSSQVGIFLIGLIFRKQINLEKQIVLQMDPVYFKGKSQLLKSKSYKQSI